MEWSSYFGIVSAIVLLVSSTSAESSQCYPSPRCFCQSSSFGELEYQCDCKPEKDDCNDAFYLRFKAKDEIRISCNRLQKWPTMFKELNVSGPFRKITLRNCTLPDGSFTSLLHDYGITDVVDLHLEFLSNGNTALKNGYFDGLTSLQFLYIQYSSIRMLPDGLFQGLTNLERLYLDNNELTSVTADSFKSLSGLRFLELGRNNLTHFTGGTFKYTPNLVLLNAYSNHLRDLTRDVFTDVRKLKFLDVQSNEITSLDNDVFEDLPELNDLNLSFNNISYLPDSIFANKNLLSRIRATQAQGSNVTGLPPNFFSNLKSLKTLKLDYNNFEYLPNRVFSKTYNLTSLTLKKNKLIALGENVFEDTPNLETLNLGYNRLISLNATIFKSMTKLTELFLGHNQLKFLDQKVFQSLTGLNNLFLENNQLTSLEPQIFSSLIHLKSINLSNNRVNMSSGLLDDSVLNSCKEIETINLSNNTVPKIYRDWLLVFIYLKELNLSYNRIEKLNAGDLDFISGFVTVDLSNNNITEVNLKFSNLIGVSTDSSSTPNILLDHNPLICDCRAYDLARYFQHKVEYNELKLSANNLSCSEPLPMANMSLVAVDLYDLTCPLSKIQTVNNDFNFGHYCPSNCTCFYRPVDDAVVIDCDGTRIRNLPSPPPAKKFAFNNTELLMSNNHLTSVRLLQPWLKQINVTRLSLASNKLQVHNVGDLILPPSLKVLELHDNKFSNLDKFTVERLNQSANLRNITLYQNPWKCDCELSYLVNFLRTQYQKVNLLNNVTCAINGKPLVELSLEDLCHFSVTVIIICVSLASFGLLFGTLIVLYYHYENEIKIWLFSHKICLWLVTEKEMDRDKEYDAFISYSHKDEPFIVEHLVPELEGGDNPFKLCIHIRDWKVGEFIPRQIVDSVANSRRTIIVLSPNFLTSSWGQVEFREAYLKMVKERCPRVIIILLEDIGDTNELNPELKTYLTMNTYLKWGDPWFWQKLRYAMPHPQKYSKRETISLPSNYLSTNGLLQMNKLNNNVATLPYSYFEPCKGKDKFDNGYAKKIVS